MLELRPCCENCGKNLPNGSDEAMICSYECTFCSFCVSQILYNVCPNCGGGFEKRPTRPQSGLEIFPMKTEKILKPVNENKYLITQRDIDPIKR